MDDRLPYTDAPPYWQPVTAEEIEAVLGVPLPSDFFGLAPGWTLAVLTIAKEGGTRIPRAGFVKDAFAIFGDFVGHSLLTGNLTHLPTGALIAQVYPKEDAVNVAALIAPLADWATVTLESACHLQVPAVLQMAGFESCTVWCERNDCSFPVFSRTETFQ